MLLTCSIKHSAPRDRVNAEKGLNFPSMTISSNATTLCGAPVIVAAGAGEGGRGGAVGGAAAGGAAYEVGVCSSGADVTLGALRACSSARSSRREVAASRLR